MSKKLTKQSCKSTDTNLGTMFFEDIGSYINVLLFENDS